MHAVEDQDQVNVDAVDVQEVQDQVQVQVGGWKVQDGFSQGFGHSWPKVLVAAVGEEHRRATQDVF